MTGWPSALGVLFRGMTLENFPRDPAETLLIQDGLDRASGRPRLPACTRSSPVLPARRLRAGGAAGRQPRGRNGQGDHGGPTEIYLGVLDPRTREILDAASVVRRPTLSLLAAMLPEMAPQDALIACGGCRS